MDSDVTAVTREHFVDASQQTKSTVGLMVSTLDENELRLDVATTVPTLDLIMVLSLVTSRQVKDGIVTNLLTGAPASLCNLFEKGDRVVQVDNTKVDEHGTNLTKMLIGSDIPGSLVKVYFRRGETQYKEVTLKRACTTELADRRRMFQLFTQIKDLALQFQTEGVDHAEKAKLVAPVVDETISLWSKMQEAEVRYDEKLVNNIHTMQSSADQAVRTLRERLSKLHSISLSAVSGAGNIAEQEANLSSEIVSLREQLRQAQVRCSDLEEQVVEAEEKHAALEKEYAILQKEHARCSGIITGLEAQLATLNEKLSRLEKVYRACKASLGDLVSLKHAPCDKLIDSLRRELKQTQVC